MFVPERTWEAYDRSWAEYVRAVTNIDKYTITIWMDGKETHEISLTIVATSWRQVSTDIVARSSIYMG